MSKTTEPHHAGMASITAAANFLSVSRNHVYGMIHSGQIPATRFGKSLRIPWQWLHAQADCNIAGLDATR